MNIYDVMSYITGFSKLGEPVKNLDRFEKIMNALGNPQNKLRYIHVAGTNGKGSTVRMLADILTDAGYKTGEYTSPYIRIYNDRIRIDGENISDEDLCAVVSEIKPVLDGISASCSQFEISTAIAFKYFAAKGCDVVVLEAGLGGLLDCTNIVSTTEISVITHIALDHTKILGGTIEQIARQKAGIIKSGAPVVLAARQQREAEIVVHGTAAALGCDFIMPDVSKLKIISCGDSGSTFRYKGRLYNAGMLGQHQIDNALTAIEAAEVLYEMSFDISYKNIRNGIARAYVPSRCQVLQKSSPLIIIDGAHNPDGMGALAEFVRTVDKSPKIMVCGMMETKDWHTALEIMSPYVDEALCVDGFAANTVFASRLAEMFAKGRTVSLSEAVEKAVKLAGDKGMVIIAGSLYLAAALQKMMPESKLPFGK